MAELTQAQIEAKITQLDTDIKTITDAIGDGGTGAAQYVDYRFGSVAISASQKLKLLMEARKYYQGLLGAFPKEIARDHPYDIAVIGDDDTDYQGDE